MGVPLSLRLLGREIDPKRSFIGVKRQLTQDVTTKFNILSHLKTHDEIYKYSIEHRNEFWRKVANDSIYFKDSANIFDQNWTKIKGNNDAGDGCWRQRVLVTTLEFGRPI